MPISDALGLDDTDSLTKPITDPSGNPVAQNALEADRQAKLQQYLKRVRDQRDADITDAGDGRITQSDRDQVATDNENRSTVAGLSNALNFTGLFGGPKQTSALAQNMEEQNKNSSAALAQRQAGQDKNLTIARQDRNDAQNMLNEDDNAAIKQQGAAQNAQMFATKQAQTAELNDPNSQRSKIARQLAQQYMPQADFTNANAAQLEPQLAQLEKAYGAQESHQARVDVAHEGALNRGGAKDLQISEKQNQTDEKTMERLGKDLQEDVSSGRSAYGVAAKKVQGAQAARALIEQAKGQQGGLDSRQMRELATSVNTLLGGSNAVSQIEDLIPSTAGMALAKAKEFVTGAPAGTNTQAFTQRLEETLNREEEIAKKQISANQGKAVSKYKPLATRRPDDVALILDKSGIDVPKQFKEWGLPVPAQYASTSAPTAPTPAPSAVDLSSIDAELARRGHK